MVNKTNTVGSIEMLTEPVPMIEQEKIDRAGMRTLRMAIDKDDAIQLLAMLGINPRDIGKEPAEAPAPPPPPRATPRRRKR